MSPSATNKRHQTFPQKKETDYENRQYDLAESLHEVATILNSNLDQQTLLDKIFEQLDRLVDHDGGALFLQEGTDLLLCAGIGQAAKAHLGERIPLNSLNPTAQVFNKQRLLFLREAETAAWLNWPEDDTIYMWIGAPLFANQQVIGVLTIDSFRQEAFSQEDARILQTFANHAAIAIQNARLFKALQTSEARYRAMIQDQTDLICRFLPDGRLTFVNDTYCRYFGQERQSLIGRTSDDLIYEEDRMTLNVDWTEPPITDQVIVTEHRVIAADGEVRWVQWHTRALLDDQGKLIEYQAVGRDTTQQKLMAKQLSRAQKLEAFSHLAAGIAHHFNNMLTTILGFVDLSLEALPDDHQAAHDLHIVKRTANRAAILTHQLLIFTRRQQIQPKVTDLNDFITYLAPLFRQMLPQTIELTVSLAPGLKEVELDTDQIEQLLINLVLNARDAMPDGGKLTITTTNICLDQEQKHPDQVPSGDYVQLLVEDTGIGMTETVQSRIFEPFFTTKAIGQGTGLGLSTCFGIVEQHAGHIVVDSAPNQGSRFYIYLP